MPYLCRYIFQYTHSAGSLTTCKVDMRRLLHALRYKFANAIAATENSVVFHLSIPSTTEKQRQRVARELFYLSLVIQPRCMARKRLKSFFAERTANRCEPLTNKIRRSPGKDILQMMSETEIVRREYLFAS